MNYYGPRELKDAEGKPTGKFHYTVQNRRTGTAAVGNCSPWESCPVCKTDRLKMYDMSGKDDCETCHGKRIVKKANPCPGHDTPEEACEHQRQYELDHARYYKESEHPNPDKISTKHKCQAPGCEVFTAGVATWGDGGMRQVMLCDAHNNRETLDPFVQVGESASSY